MSEVPLYLECMVQHLLGGFRVRGSASVGGLGCRVQGSGCSVQGAGCWVQGSGCRVQGAGCRGGVPRCQCRARRCWWVGESTGGRVEGCVGDGVGS